MSELKRALTGIIGGPLLILTYGFLSGHTVEYQGPVNWWNRDISQAATYTTTATPDTDTGISQQEDAELYAAFRVAAQDATIALTDDELNFLKANNCGKDFGIRREVTRGEEEEPILVETLDYSTITGFEYARFIPDGSGGLNVLIVSDFDADGLADIILEGEQDNQVRVPTGYMFTQYQQGIPVGHTRTPTPDVPMEEAVREEDIQRMYRVKSVQLVIDYQRSKGYHLEEDRCPGMDTNLNRDDKAPEQNHLDSGGYWHREA